MKSIRLPLSSLLLWLPLACGDSSDPLATATNATAPQTTAPATISTADPTSAGSDASSTGATGDPTTTGSTTATTTTTSTTSQPSTGEPGTGSTTTADPGTTTLTTDTTGTTGGDGVVPPLGGSSGGQGGGAAAGELKSTGGGIDFRLIAPGGAGPHPLMIVYSGVEGGQTMTNNLLQVADFTGTGDFVFAVLDGKTYNGNGAAGADVLDAVRATYDIDNDRTFLLSESAGTTAGLQLGLSLRQSYFAAYWANDVNASATPDLGAAELGFQPWGNAGPGGQFAQADAIVAGMTSADYRIEQPAPYDGPGADQHGSPDQFIAALQWFPGKSRQ